MSLSIHYWLSLPIEQDARQKLAALREAASTFVSVSPLYTLDALDCALSQATMNEHLRFVRAISRQIGANRRAPLGTPPIEAHYFRASSFDIGLGRFNPGSIKMLTADEYDGRWWAWMYADYIDPNVPRTLVRILSTARDLGFSAAWHDEADDIRRFRAE